LIREAELEEPVQTASFFSDSMRKPPFTPIANPTGSQVIIPLEQPANRYGWYQTVDQIDAGDSTNLMAGWLLGRDELMKARETAGGIAPIRKILLLTDGHLNARITERDRVEALTRAGLDKDEIRTSCLGFGDSYIEHILAAMSKVGQGQLHHADSPEKFPVILADELDGLQKITVQNLRLRIQQKLFCNAWKQYGDYPQVQLPDGRTELALGDNSSNINHWHHADRLRVPRVQESPFTYLLYDSPSTKV
jgi:hypothetical protein